MQQKSTEGTPKRISSRRGSRQRRGVLLKGLGILLLTPLAHAQAGLWDAYQLRVDRTLANQPHWATPLVTVNARIEEGFRADFVRQTTSAGAKNWNLGGTKGLQVIPLPRVELRFSPPPFFLHANPRTEQGFGDFAIRTKVRLYGSNEAHHNAIVTAYLGASVPTGKSGNGSCCAILSPFLEFGKGFGHLALTTSAGGSLPVSGTNKLGRSLTFNNAIQYRVGKLVWLQTEFNSTYFFGAANDGRQQTFTTPGVVISRIPILRGEPGRPDKLAASFGAGEQIALTHFSTYNHSPIFTGRLRF